MPTMSQVKPVVLELGMGLDIGGAETHVVSLSKSLKSMGWQVYVASSGGRRVADLAIAGIPHYEVPLNSRNPIDILRAYRMLVRIIKMHPVDLIHAHARIPAWIGTFIGGRCQIPVVTTYHWTFVSGFPWNLVTRPGDWTIAVSHDIKQYVIRQFGFCENRITVVSNGIDCSEFRPISTQDTQRLRSTAGLTQADGPVIAYASRLTKELATTACEVIEAVALLARSQPNVCLLIAGDGDHLERVQQAATATNERTGHDLVRCLGFVSEMAPVYQVSDLVIGMSRVVLEAMACGKPCIVAGPQGDYGLVTSDIIEGLEVRNFTSRDASRMVDPFTLAAEIRTALSDEQTGCIGDFCRDYVSRTHSTDSAAARVEAVYLKIIESESAHSRGIPQA